MSGRLIGVLMIAALVLGGCANRHSVMAPSFADTDQQYRLAPGDKLHVIVFGEDTLTGDYVLTSAGNLTFPLVGNLPSPLTGRSNSFRPNSRRRLVTATSTMRGSASRSFLTDHSTSLGEVNRPGEYPVSTGLTIQQAVASAGGYTYRANTKRVFLKRADETRERLIDLRATPGLVVHAGDTIRITERHF